jgi:acetolactate synthase-1/2/3 large subunit
MLRVADYIMQKLHDSGVNHVFQVTGRGSLFLSDALAKNKNLTAISLHHEQSCSFAAVGYAEQSEGLGVALVSTGCASTNTLTGVLTAWQDGIPCVFISGQNVLKETTNYTKVGIRTYGQQEADIIKLVTPITKFATMLTNPQDIVQVMEEAIGAALTGRKGPVWIDVPLDLQSSLIEPVSITNTKLSSSNFIFPEAKADDLALVVNLLNNSERPIILMGKGVRSSGAYDELMKFVDQTQIPVTYSASAVDIFGSSESKLSIGSVGAMGCSRAGNFAVANSDFVLVLGSRLNSLTTGPDYCDFARGAKVVVVDIDIVEHKKESVKIDHFIHLDLKLFLSQLNKYMISFTSDIWINKCLHWKQLFSSVEEPFNSNTVIDLYQLSDTLSKKLPKASSLVVDSGLAEVILPSNMRFTEGMRCIHPTSQGAMGFAVPASIGIQFATKGLVLVVVGDGSIMMNLQELESIRYHKLPIKIIVVNNNVYSIIRKRQKDLFRTRTIGTDPDNGVSVPDFKKVADCFGLEYMKIENIESLDKGIDELFSIEGSVLCELMGNENQSYIEIGTIRSSESGKIVRRPPEDQMPFLDRELFKAEMIIEPIKQ